MQSVAFEDFSGGLTDYPLSAGKNKCKVLDNVLLRQYEGGGKPFTRPGSLIFDPLAPQLPTGNQRISTMFEYKGVLFAQTSQKLYWYKKSTNTWEDILGPTGNNAFPQATTSSRFTYGTWNFHVLLTHTPYGKPKKVYINNSGIPKVVEAGLPTPVITGISGSGAGHSRIIKLVFKVEYTTSGNIKFIDYSEPSLPDPLLSNIYVGDYPITVTYTSIANSTSFNYDTANIKLEAYCTVDNGATYYKAGEVNNSVGTIVINPPGANQAAKDAALSLLPVIYTSGGIVGNASPLPSEVVHVVDEVAYYGGVYDGTQFLEYRVMASVASDIDSVPSTFYVDLDDKVVGISSTKSNVVALGRFTTCRLQNNQDELGQGFLSYERISDTASCASGGGVVQTLYGVFWAGFDGIYYTDGYEVRKLNREYDRTYKTWTHDENGDIDYVKASKIQGRYSKQANTITWSVQKGLVDIDTLYILDLTYGIRENSSFTTWSGGAPFSPTAFEYVNGTLIRGDSRGYVLYHDDAVFTDPKIDTMLAASAWATSTIIYNITTIDYDFGTSVTRKYVPLVVVACDASTNLSLQITSDSDTGRVAGVLRPIRSKSVIPWGVDSIYWGDSGIPWNVGGLVHEKRRMPHGSLRCNYKSLTFTNAKVALVSSDKLGLASINGTLKTLTLNGALLFAPSSVGYFVALAQDNYVIEYEISTVSGGVLTLIDSAGNLVDAVGMAWVVRGYPKGEVLNLLNATLNYEMFGPTQGVYTSAQSGEVGS